MSQNKNNIDPKIIFLIFLMLILTACSLADKDASTSTPLSPTMTHTIEPTPLLTPSRPIDTSTAIPPPTPPPTLEPSLLLVLIKAELLATDCSPPCVFGIIPGQTKANEVPNILEPLKVDGIVEDFYLVEHPQSTRYDVQFASYPLSISIQIDETENIVLTIGHGTGYRLITFGDIIERFGEPTYVLPARWDTFDTLFLEYPDEHLRVQVRTDFLYQSHLPISLEMAVRNLVYESPEVSQVRLSSSTWAMWEGYKSFDYYYMVQDQLEEQGSG